MQGRYRLLAVASVWALEISLLASTPVSAQTASGEAPTIEVLPSHVGYAHTDYVPAGWTGDDDPEFSGTADAGSTVTVVVDGTIAVPVKIAEATWTATMDTTIPDGAHTAVVSAVPPGGGTPTQATTTFHVDATPPAAPVILGPDDNAFVNAPPELRVQTETDAGLPAPGNQVQILWDHLYTRDAVLIRPDEHRGPRVATDQQDVATFAFAPYATEGIAGDGRYLWHPQVFDEVGNYVDGEERWFVIDSIAPPKPTIDAIGDPDDVTTLTGTLPADPHYVNPYPTAPVDAPDTRFEITIDGKTYENAALDPVAGTWSLALATPLAAAPAYHAISARWGDTAGNWSAPAMLLLGQPPVPAPTDSPAPHSGPVTAPPIPTKSTVTITNRRSAPRPGGWQTAVRRSNTIQRDAVDGRGRLALSFQVFDSRTGIPVTAGIPVALVTPNGRRFALHPASARTSKTGTVLFALDPGHRVRPGVYRFKVAVSPTAAHTRFTSAATWLIRVVA